MALIAYGMKRARGPCGLKKRFPLRLLGPGFEGFTIRSFASNQVGWGPVLHELQTMFGLSAQDRMDAASSVAARSTQSRSSRTRPADSRLPDRGS